jgi:hypothetical protein
MKRETMQGSGPQRAHERARGRPIGSGLATVDDSAVAAADPEQEARGKESGPVPHRVRIGVRVAMILAI